MSHVDPINNFHSGGSRHAADLARSMPAARPAKAKTARARISAAKSKKSRPASLGPTPERLAKGDLAAPRTFDGFHRSIAAVERLRDQGKLDHVPNMNEAMFQAAQKLQRHFDGCMVGVKAQDLNKVISSGGSDQLTQEESWVHHFDQFQKACKLMGWSDTNPHRGAGRIVVAVVCYETNIRDAAAAHLGSGRMETLQITAMDRLREGLFCLATHWRLC